MCGNVGFGQDCALDDFFRAIFRDILLKLLISSGLCAMASHVVVRQAVGFIYPAYKSLQAVMTEEDQVIFNVVYVVSQK